MKITYGNKELKIKYSYLAAFLFVFLTESLLSQLLFGGGTQAAAAAGESGSLNLDKFIIPIALGVSIFNINRYSNFLRAWIIVSLFYIFILMLESYYLYNNLFKYPHVFSKITIIYVIFFICHFFREIEHRHLDKVIYAILIIFTLHLVILKPYILSIGSFLSTTRGFSAASTFSLLLLCLYFLNKYLLGKNSWMMLLFFFTLGLIVFLQHRTVWIATLVALAVNFLLAGFKSDNPFRLKAFMPLIAIPFIIGFIGFAFILSDNPEIINKFAERVLDIKNAETEGTGSWRLIQFKSYAPFIKENLVAGMRFRGFELPVQFYMPDSDQPVFEDGYGHHFHSFYVDELFYIGIIGSLILLMPAFYLIKTIIYKPKLTLEEIVLCSFIVSGFFYGFSYILPTYYFGLVGIALAFSEQSVKIVEDIQLQSV